MSNRKTDIDSMASAINEGLLEYATLAADDMKKAVRKTATSVKNDIQSTAPVDTGRYRASWTTKKTSENSESIEYTVYSKDRYQLAHLLEHGHAKRGGGRVEARPHIAAAEANGEKTLEDLIKEAMKG